MLDPLWREVCHSYYYASSSSSGWGTTTDGNIHAHRKIIQQRFSLFLFYHDRSFIYNEMKEQDKKENKNLKIENNFL